MPNDGRVSRLTKRQIERVGSRGGMNDIADRMDILKRADQILGARSEEPYDVMSVLMVAEFLARGDTEERAGIIEMADGILKSWEFEGCDIMDIIVVAEFLAGDRTESA